MDFQTFQRTPRLAHHVNLRVFIVGRDSDPVAITAGDDLADGIGVPSYTAEL
jgi:hypothetical protein